jgi:L-threonylcarbamoyladenylate synthase
METIILPISDPNSLARALEILTSGGLVAFPTDTVYGLGALAYDANAVGEIYVAKGRGLEKAIPVLIGDFDQIERVAAGTNHLVQRLAEKFWPGPLTMIVPRNPNIPDAVTPFLTVGVRIPDFNATRELIRLTGPLAVTSANVSGQGSPSTAMGVLAQLDGKIPLILDGGVTPGGIPSTLVDCTGNEPKLLREGPISLQQILDALK